VANVSATSVFCPQGYRERRKRLRYRRCLKRSILVRSRRPLPGSTPASRQTITSVRCASSETPRTSTSWLRAARDRASSSVIRPVGSWSMRGRRSSAYYNHQLRFPGTLAAFSQPGPFHAMLSTLRHQKWVVYAKAPFGGPEYVLKYLARYTHRVAIAHGRALGPEQRPGAFQMARLQRQQPHPGDEPRCGRVHPSLSASRSAWWLRQDPPLRAARQPQSPLGTDSLPSPSPGRRRSFSK
jgi:hypothetical protein